ncbi:MAG TPA: hypothetical protein PKB02_06040 [Anaerohalosphaeraceae bacterium]|nr:hypothetical protein [Anaerohalosphaeraceae bacterium]
MKYEEPKQISYEEALAIFEHGTPEEISGALIALSFYEKNVSHIERWSLYWCNSNNIEISSAAIMSFGHIARIHGRITKEVVIPVLNILKDRQGLQGVVSDAIDDIDLFTQHTDRS